MLLREISDYITYNAADLFRHLCLTLLLIAIVSEKKIFPAILKRTAVAFW